MPLLLAIFSLLPIFLFSGKAYAGCEKDTDCKGDRICEASVCVNPTPAPAAQTAPWSDRDDPALGAASSGSTNSIGMKFVSITAGSFEMGSPSSEGGRGDDETLHSVRLTKSFLMATKEVTQRQWRAVMGSNPSMKDYDEGVSLIGNTLPVQNVSWEDAVKFANALSKKEGLRAAYRISGKSVSWDKSANGYRLPTEAEWEYAARANTRGLYSGTSSEGSLCTVANIADRQARRKFDWQGTTASCDDGHAGPAPVGSFKPNAWGLYDMSGNVWEWCWDRYDKKYGGSSTDPVGAQSGDYRVVRGGSWNFNPAFARVADRVASAPGDGSLRLGLRLVTAEVPATVAPPLRLQAPAGPPAPPPVAQQGGGIWGYQGAGSGGLGIAAQLAEQTCDEKSKTLGDAAREIKLDAAQATSQSAAGADWGRMKRELQLCVKLKRSKRTPCITQTEQWLRTSRSMSVTLGAGTEVVQTDCGPRSPVFAAQTRSFSAAEVPAAEALLVQLGAADAPVAGSASAVSGTNSVGMKFVAIAAGSFEMGDAQHRVRLSKSFMMSTTEVTQGQWQAVMGSNPSRFSYCGADCPVEKVSWFDAVKFANALSKKEGLRAAYRITDSADGHGHDRTVSWDKSATGYRLPTEAEWEYAARGGQRHVYSGSNTLSVVGWTKKTSGRFPKTHKVAGKRANAWGLYDMSGNVWEWCWDWKGDYSGSSTDPVGAHPMAFPMAVNRVRRGGSWDLNPASARVANRSWNTPVNRYSGQGLRLVRTKPSQD